MPQNIETNPSNEPLLVDLRRTTGTIHNRGNLATRFELGANAAHASVDRFLYEGFRKGGASFLDEVRGNFGAAYFDKAKSCVFLARDWIGETPLHWIMSDKQLAVANSLADLRDHLGNDFAYEYVRSFPQSKYAVIEFTDDVSGPISKTARFANDGIYYNFSNACNSRLVQNESVRENARTIRRGLDECLREQLADQQKAHVLLSGGLDSFGVATVLRQSDIPVESFTLSIGKGGEDVERAEEFARQLGIKHHVLQVTKNDVLAAAKQAIAACEIYHSFNVYCAVGMLLLADALKRDDVACAFCGEGVNEALGDYRDWRIMDPCATSERILQRIDAKRMEQVSERVLYVWGQPTDRGKYNRQLGTGLAKHAGSRMFKPFLFKDISLKSPYYDRDVLASMVSITPNVLNAVGGKPGIFAAVFADDMSALNIPESLIRSSAKVRMQDASEGGANGITPILLEAGFNQQRLIEDFNDRFGANLDPVKESKRIANV